MQSSRRLTLVAEHLSHLRAARRTFSSRTPTQARSQVSPFIAAFAGASAVAAAFYMRDRLYRQPVLNDAPEEYYQPTVRPKQSSDFASKEVRQDVIRQLKAKLRPDQVSDDKDDLLGHGQSPNTYHDAESLANYLGFEAAAVPDVVVYVESTEDVSEVMKLAYANRMPVIPYSGGTNLEGHCTAPFGGICVDLSRMDEILEVHEEDSDLVVQAGCRWEDINAELVERGIPLFFPLDPGPGACIGGMLSNGCSGTNAVRYGTAKGEWFLNATIVLANGEVIKTRQRSRKSSAGYDLTKLFIGAEGTLGIVTQATIKLTPLLPTKVAVCGFPGVQEACTAVGEIINQGVSLQCVELCDSLMMNAINRFGNITHPLPEADSIFFKFSGSPEAMALSEGLVAEITKKHGGKDLMFARNDEESAELWRARKASHWSAMALVPGGTCYSTDVCVPVSNLPQLVKETKEDLKRNGIVGPVLGHVGDGNFHCALIFRADIPGEFEKVDAAAHRMVERAIALDGTCTGEHGVGIGKRQFLRSELGDGTVEVMKSLKNTMDPRGILNPGKLLPE